MTAVETYDDGVPPRRGVSLAKGPVAIIGALSLALGILGFIFASQSFTMHPPSGTVNGSNFIGIEGNGWTWALFAAGGLLLLLGAPIHWGAKSMAFMVGIAYGVGALIALSDGSDILGIFATNNVTKIVLGAAAVALVLLSMMPRVGRRRGAAPVAAREPAARGRFGRRAAPADRPVEREPVATNGGTLDDRTRRA
jgi:fumarate reductase subunit D